MITSTSERQVKSKQRVADHGEVFTAEREVKAMCDLVKQETERIESRFLEPACGDGNFLAEILFRKLAVVTKRYKPLRKKNVITDSYHWERKSLLALGSIYGVDILADNAQICRDRLYSIWEKEYKAVCKKECNEETKAAARFILRQNIVCGNALTLMYVDEQQQDTDDPIIFSEWSLPFDDAQIQRKDYIFAELVNAEEPKQKKKDNRQSLFDIYPDAKPDEEGIFLQQYITHYRRLSENG